MIGCALPNSGLDEEGPFTESGYERPADWGVLSILHCDTLIPNRLFPLPCLAASPTIRWRNAKAR